MTAYIEALDALAYSRPRLDPNDYIGAAAAYRADQRGNVQALNDYRAIRAMVAPDDAPLADVARGSRIEFVQLIGSVKDRVAEREPGVRADYLPGQYYPVEYRPACVRLLARVWWQLKASQGYDADAIRKRARLVFGRGVARRWFN